MSLSTALPGVACPPLISMSEFEECVLELSRSGAGVKLSWVFRFGLFPKGTPEKVELRPA